MAYLEPVTDQWLIQTRRQIHAWPEPGWAEFVSAARVIEHLEKENFKVLCGREVINEKFIRGAKKSQIEEGLKFARERGVSEAILARLDGVTGVVGILETGRPGPKVGFRCELDCVPGTETDDPEHIPNKEGFASQHPGYMHACGHDGHQAVMMGLATWLNANRDQLCGTVKLIFQPAEEGVRGATPMERAGAVKGVDEIFGMHIGFQANNIGKVICGTKNFLATTKADITFTGVPAHAGNAPEEGKNALLSAATALLNMHAIPRSGKGDTRITVGKLNGGEGRNVIPPKATLVLETRGITSALDEYMFGEVKRIAKAAAEMWGCGYSIDLKGGTKSGESDLEVAKVVAEEARDMGCFTDIIEEQNFGASEDYSHFMSTVQAAGGKGTYVQVGSTLRAGHHNSHFDFDEQSLANALELMSRCVYRTLAK